MQNHSLVKKIFLVCSLFTSEELLAQVTAGEDTVQRKKQYSYFLNLKDQPLNRFNYNYSPFFNLFPSQQKSTVEFDALHGNFSLNEKIGNQVDAKMPQAMSFKEYSEIQDAQLRRSIMRDFEKASDGISTTSGKRSNPILDKNPVFDRIFGGKLPEFKPAGYLGFGLKIYEQYMPGALTQQYRHTTGMDAKPDIGINFNNFFNGQSASSSNPAIDQPNPNYGNKTTDVVAMARQVNQAKDKMNILGNFDTKSSFNFENKFKINFKNEPEDILQKVELGNISMPNRSQLIPGVQNLLGAKVGLRFGKLDITTVFAQQKSRTESIYINGGSQSKPFEIKSDAYEENKHFFLAQFFRDKFEGAMATMPNPTSGIRISRVEVYVTNRIASTGTTRDIVGLTDLGEFKEINNANIKINQNSLDHSHPASSSLVNSLAPLIKDTTNRQTDNVRNTIANFGQLNLQNKADYEVLTGAKRLSEREFDFNPELGYISLMTPLRNDEVLAVSYEYSYYGKIYKVGEMAEDYAQRKNGEVIYLKLLKSSTIRSSVNSNGDISSPMWNLMMKNIYSLPMTQIKREGFQLRVIYKDDKTGLDSPYLPDPNIAPVKNTILTFVNLDKLNYYNDRIPDGNFDFVEGVTINTRTGKIIFPVLQPFGTDLQKALKGQIADDQISKYVFTDLYTKTLSDAQQQNTKTKFFLTGSVQSGGTDVPLPLGSTGATVRAYAGGIELKQGVDFMVDPQMGMVRILNQSILSSGRSIRVDFEKPDMFQAQVRRFFGLRLDYMVGRYLHLGGTMMALKENTPGAITRTAIGNEPVNNTLFGLDMNLKKQSYAITKFLDKLPGIQTKETSSIAMNAEIAALKAGVNKKVNGNSMVDDFEFARNINDLGKQATKWKLGSVPADFIKNTGVAINNKRAKISAYSIDPSLYINGSTYVSKDVLARANSTIYEKSYQQQEIFPGKSQQVSGLQLPFAIFDLAYFPSEPGMYNYNTALDDNGKLKNPKDNFGAVMRGLNFDSDFNNSNIQFIEFWMLNPFKGEIRNGDEVINTADDNTYPNGGKFLIQLGDVSEDVIPDNRNDFENGINRSVTGFGNINEWGYSPKEQYISDALSPDNAIRLSQDVGLDGLPSDEEGTYVKVNNKSFKDALPATLSATAKTQILNDPAKDDFKHYLDPSFTNESLITRYKSYMGTERNSPALDTKAPVNLVLATTADKEDINQDNNVNDNESYFQYEVDFTDKKSIEIGKNNIVDKVTSGTAEWYLFRIPIDKPSYKRNNPSLKSIRFARLVTTGWAQPVVMRFAALQLVSNQYRVFPYKLSNHANSFDKIDSLSNLNIKFKSATVNIEENGCANPDSVSCVVKEGTLPYQVPPGFRRDVDYNNVKANVQYNEQSLSLTAENLPANDSRAVFKNVKLDLNMYKSLQMAVHSHNIVGTDNITRHDDPSALFVRLGTDNTNNYYEIEIPKITHTEISPSASPLDVWPTANNLDIPLDYLRNLKLERNKVSTDTSKTRFDLVYPKSPVTVQVMGSDGITRPYNIKVIGNPDLSNILSLMIGVKNIDTQGPRSFSIWVDELRTNGYVTGDANNGNMGIAFVYSTDIKLADIGNIMLNVNHKSPGFGGLQDRISNRSRENYWGFGGATSLALDRFLPQKWGLSIPFYGNYDRQTSKPYYNPLDPDIKLSQAELFGQPISNSQLQAIAMDKTVTKGFNFTNVKKTKTGIGQTKDHFYDIENFTASYAFTNLHRSNVLLQGYDYTQMKAALNYSFSPKGITWSPFKNNVHLQNQNRKWLKDFNLSPIPNLIAFRSDYVQSSTTITYRSANLINNPNPDNSIKYFLGNRYYNVGWGLTKSVNVNYDAVMTSIQDLRDSARIGQSTSFLNGLTHLGRPKTYMQKLSTTWRIPLDKLFWLDWIKADAKFITSFGYKAGSWGLTDNGLAANRGGLLMGNLIENGREESISGQVDLIKLYNKFRYLRLANTPSAPREKFTRSPGDDEEIIVKNNNLAKTITRLLMTVRGINMTYGKVENTILPGYLGQPTIMGMDMSGKYKNAPGMDFALFGSQNYGIINKGISNHWLSKSDSLNNPFIQNRGVKFEYNTSLEPFKGLRIQIKGNRTRNDGYQEIYRTIGDPNSPMRMGNFNMSFWGFKTFFSNTSDQESKQFSSDLYNNMLKYRSQMVSKLNGISGENKYSISDQDVLIGAFYAAYSGKSTNQIMKKGTINLFPLIPLPNWRIDWSGLEKLPLFNEMFKSITFNHSYNSTLSVGNYTSSLQYAGYQQFLLNKSNSAYPISQIPSTVNTLQPSTGVVVPVWVMSTITLEENFSPLAGIQFVTKNKITGTLNFNKQRSAQLNLNSQALSEMDKKGFTLGMGMVRNNVKIPLRGRDGNSIVLKNDLNLKLDINYNKNMFIVRQIDGTSKMTTGLSDFTVNPSFNYQINRKINLGGIFTHQVTNNPTNMAVSRRFNQMALNVRFNLGD